MPRAWLIRGYFCPCTSSFRLVPFSQMIVHPPCLIPDMHQRRAKFEGLSMGSYTNQQLLLHFLSMPCQDNMINLNSFVLKISGILLYEMLYGRTPFRGKNRQKTFANILHKDLTFPSSIPVSNSDRYPISVINPYL